MTVFPLDAEDLAREIDTPLRDWPLNCHGIALRVLKDAPIRGMRLARGHYHGFISRKSAYRGDVAQHTWLVLEDGRILDPTRWAMETPASPMIYLGPNDVYDEAGLELMAKCGPRFPSARRGFEMSLSKAPRPAIAMICESLQRSLPTDFDPEGLDMSRLATAIHSELQCTPEQMKHSKALFQGLSDAGLKALIKLDVWNCVMALHLIEVAPGSNRIFDAPPLETRSEAQALCAILCHFLRLEERDSLEQDLEDFGYTIQSHYEALSALERAVKYIETIEDIPAYLLTDLNVVAAEFLGQGFGQGMRVERYALSLGVSRTDMDSILTRAGQRTGYDVGWL